MQSPETGFTKALGEARSYSAILEPSVRSVYESLLPGRIARASQKIAESLTDAALLREFESCWSLIKQLNRAGLSRLAQQSAVDAWVQSAERMIELGLIGRYPQAHPARLVAELSQLVMNWATHLPEGTQGTALLTGRDALWLDFGRITLLSPSNQRVARVHWERDRHTLKLHPSGGRSVVTVPIAEPHKAECHSTEWRVASTLCVQDILIDTQSLFWSRNRSLCTVAEFGDGIVAAVESINRRDDELAILVFETTRSIAASADVAPWIAGLLTLPGGESSDHIVKNLIESAFNDHLERLIAIGRLPNNGMHSRCLYTRGASKWLAAQALHIDHSSEQDKWPILQWLSSTEYGNDLLRRFGGSVDPGAWVPRIEPTRSQLELGEAVVFGALPKPTRAQLHLRKSRRGANTPNDWSCLDQLAKLDEALLTHLYSGPDSSDLITERDIFAKAALAYVLGMFIDCKTALDQCLIFDDMCEEYLHLMAFTLRHLRDHEGFERIIFDNSDLHMVSDNRSANCNDGVVASDDGGERTGPGAIPADGAPPQYSFHGLLAEIIAVRGRARQVTQYVAVLSGLRQSLDDWIPLERFYAYERLMKRLGLVVRPDCVFRSLDAEGVTGIHRAPTTRARGERWNGQVQQHSPGGSVHVILSSRTEWADETLAAGWYPLAVNGRIVVKPLVDHHRLGCAFGYPRCCVDFFLRHNDWPRQNTIAEAARRSTQFYWEANCFAKSTIWMLVFHMPCCFDCRETKRYSQDLLRTIHELDPDYARRIRTFLAMPVLSINERTAYGFPGAVRLGDQRLRYNSVSNLRQEAVQEYWEVPYADLLLKGDELEIQRGIVLVSRGGALAGTIQSRCDAGVAEVPILLDFH